MLNRVAPASAVTIQLINATTLMTASLSLVNQSARPGRCDVGLVASCGHSQLITDCLRYKLEWALSQKPNCGAERVPGLS
jgi:hypothetical protein